MTLDKCGLHRAKSNTAPAIAASGYFVYSHTVKNSLFAKVSIAPTKSVTLFHQHPQGLD
jgi:hypothetical protein